MKVADLNALSGEEGKRVNDAKEAVVDALLNLTWQRASGSGPDGEVVFGTKPSLRFVSGFLLPRYEADSQIDETSDIHISTHGLDCQIDAHATGKLVVRLDFSIYVRVLPEWSELVRPELDLFPNPPLRKDLEDSIREEMKTRIAAAREKEAAKPEGQRKQYPDLQQEIYQQLLAEHGVRVSSSDAWVADAEQADYDGESAAQGQGEDVQDDGGEPDAAQLIVQRGRYEFENDEAAQAIDIPQKWLRLPVSVESFSADLSDQDYLQEAVELWTQYLRKSVHRTVALWLEGEVGRTLAYRPRKIVPSHFRSEESWCLFLADLRNTLPETTDIAPKLDGLLLTIQSDPDLRDSSRRNLRVMLENNSREVPSRKRDRFDHAIHQVRLTAELPEAVHRRLKLDRVEPSYRFQGFLTYPALGVNCGVIETRIDEKLCLTTTWMPRYYQPRIVPNQIEDVPVRFADLGANGFDPASLRPFVSAYENWTATEEGAVDPSDGVEDLDDAERERHEFRQDVDAYRSETKRIALGIELLEFAYGRFEQDATSPEAHPYRAWLLLNRTFRDAGAERGIEGWRLFQLAFILAHIPTVVSRMDAYSTSRWFNPEFDEETATLLYFPTGGGKSEAFFGLLVFNLFFDRLRGKTTGITALIRYPLRLLTLQQAQRLLAILMKAELLRRIALIPGQPFEIGFWVGSGNTPNRPNDKRLDPVPRRESPKHQNDDKVNSAYKEVNESFNKIPTCPICKKPTGLRRISFNLADEIGIVCFNADCAWNKHTASNPLPFLIIDQDIYRHAPSVLLGVIDKLA